MTERPAGGIRKILVALDSSPGSLAALRTGADLAGRFDAELIGLYVEDINLARVAGYTFVREVSFFSGTYYDVSENRVTLMLRSQASTAHRSLLYLARLERLRTEFQVVRGSIPVEVLRAAQEADLLVLGKSGWSRKRRMGSTAHFVLSQSSRDVLILPEGRSLLPPLALIFDGQDASFHGLELAHELLDEDVPGDPPGLVVIIPAEDIHQGRALHAELEEWQGKRHRDARHFWLVGNERFKIAEFLKVRRFGGLILSAPLDAAQLASMVELINQINLPVLVARQ